MYRRRRNTQNRYGGNSNRFGFRFKIILVSVIVIAAVSAFITGAALSSRADKSRHESFGRQNLTSFGGVERPEADYAALGEIKADYVNTSGVDRQSFKSAVADADDADAVAFKANDESGSLFFAPESSVKDKLSFGVLSTVTAKELAEVCEDYTKISVAYFYSAALGEQSGELRVLKSAEELAVISELAAAGINEIAIFGVPDETDLLSSVSPYLAWAESLCERTNICVVLAEDDVKGTGATRIISATKGYADAYAIDFSRVPNAELGDMIERCAYFLTQYNMRVIVADAEEEIRAETLAILESYGIKSYEFIGAKQIS